MSNLAISVPPMSTPTGQRATNGTREHDDNRVGAAYNLLVQWDEMRRRAQDNGTYTPAMNAFMDVVSRLVATSPDPAATFEEVLNVISRERAKNTAQPYEDLLPEGVRAKTAEIRRLLDQADEMADKVTAMEAVHGQTERAEAQA